MPAGARPSIREPGSEPVTGPRSTGVEANARLTSSTAVALFFLLAVEGITVLRVHQLLSVHVFVGVLLIPPVLLKIASTTYRFSRYYIGDPAYRAKGPPAWLLRVLGPGVVFLTVVLFGTGVALLYDPAARGTLLFWHKVSFILWFLVMAVHVLGHLPESFRTGLADWTERARQVAGSGRRRNALIASLAAGAVAGLVALAQVAPYLAGRIGPFGK